MTTLRVTSPRGRGGRRGRRALLRLARDDRGAVLVELALTVPILATLMCAVMDFSLVMFTLNNLTTAVREGARFAASRRTVTANDPWITDSIVKKAIVMSGPSRGGSIGTITNTVPDANGYITVQVAGYQYVPITPFLNALGMGTISMTRRAVFRWERHQ